jgi:outer membrane immunogenic protein
MKKLWLGWFSIAALAAGPALAADLPRKAPAYTPPPPPPAFSWTGCYVGAFAGGAFTDGDPTFTDLGNASFGSFSGGVLAAKTHGPHSWSDDLGSSFIGGGTLGCNWQPVGTPFVLGVEGEVGYMRLKGQAFDPTTIQGTGQTTLDSLGDAKIGDWYGMATGRIGYAFDRVLIYVKGGAAFVPTKASVVDTCAAPGTGCGNWLIATAADKTVTTGTIGGGVEWAFAPNWSIKGEYMFIGLGGQDLTSCATATAANGVTAIGGGPFCFNHDFPGIHTVKLGINWRWDWGKSPVVQRY